MKIDIKCYYEGHALQLPIRTMIVACVILLLLLYVDSLR